jgi:hypothetical protein
VVLAVVVVAVAYVVAEGVRTRPGDDLWWLIVFRKP